MAIKGYQTTPPKNALKTLRTPSKHVFQGPGIKNSASPEPDLGQGVNTGRSPSRPRVPQPWEAMSASLEPISGERDKTRGKPPEGHQGTAAFNARTYPAQGCRCTVVTRPRSCQRFTNIITHAPLYTHAVCQPLMGHVIRQKSGLALRRKLRLARRRARRQDRTPPRPSSASATCSPTNPAKGHSFEL